MAKNVLHMLFGRASGHADQIFGQERAQVLDGPTICLLHTHKRTESLSHLRMFVAERLHLQGKREARRGARERA